MFTKDDVAQFNAQASAIASMMLDSPYRSAEDLRHALDAMRAGCETLLAEVEQQQQLCGC